LAGGTAVVAGTGGFWAGDTYASREQRSAVPGFRWSRGNGFEDPELLRQESAHTEGDQSVHSRNPEDWPTAVLIGTVATDALDLFGDRPTARLGMLYTDPDLWHAGWGLPGGTFGGLQTHQDKLYLTAALRRGHGAVDFTWALSGADGNTGGRIQLPSVLLGTMAVGEIPPGVPLL
jgi:hypothetical protein